jgi:hypothetical protein
MKLTMTPCPCGKCKKFIVEPLFGCQCSALLKEDAEELVRRWNAFEGEYLHGWTPYQIREFIEAEPELPTPIPDEVYGKMWSAVNSSREHAAEFCRSIVRITKKEMIARLGHIPTPDPISRVSAKRVKDMNVLLAKVTEFCNAIDAEDEDIGGHRPSREIIGEIGPLVDKLNGR